MSSRRGLYQKHRSPSNSLHNAEGLVRISRSKSEEMWPCSYNSAHPLTIPSKRYKYFIQYQPRLNTEPVYVPCWRRVLCLISNFTHDINKVKFSVFLKAGWWTDVLWAQLRFIFRVLFLTLSCFTDSHRGLWSIISLDSFFHRCLFCSLFLHSCISGFLNSVCSRGRLWVNMHFSLIPRCYADYIKYLLLNADVMITFVTKVCLTMPLTVL